MRIGNMRNRNPFPNDPGLFGIKRENLVSELTPWNYKQKGVCRIGPNGPLYVYLSRGELIGKKKDGRLYYCVRVFNWGEYNGDFKELSSALAYANCETESELAICSRMATTEEYPPDMPGTTDSYVVGGTILEHMSTDKTHPEITVAPHVEQTKRPCPSCSSFRVISIYYGLPAGDAMEREQKGEIELRGCVVGSRDPTWRCENCRMVW